MRIHTKATAEDVTRAAKVARVTLDTFSEHKSRKSDRAFEVKLAGESRRRQNGGGNYAATWDQWGVFLAVLFEVDPGTSSWAYRDAYDFTRRTGGRFNDKRASVDYATGPVFWPADAHGDHRFEYAGRPGEQECRKCSAVTRWDVPA